MRNGITISHQKQIIASTRRVMRVQMWSAIVMLLLVIGAWAFPTQRQAPLAVAMVQQAAGAGGGAGFLVTPHSVLTAANVVGSQQDVLVTFRDQPPVQAHVAFTDPKHDIALLELQSAVTIPPLPTTDSSIVADGDEAVVVGYPGGEYTDNQHTKLSSHTPELFTTDIAPLPGNSGGPLMRSDGTVIGLVASTAEFGGAQNARTHVAVPINVVKKVCREQNHAID